MTCIGPRGTRRLSLLLAKVSKRRETGSRGARRSLAPPPCRLPPTPVCVLGGGGYAARRKDWEPGRGPASRPEAAARGQRLGPDCGVCVLTGPAGPSSACVTAVGERGRQRGAGASPRNSPTCLFVRHSRVFFFFEIDVPVFLFHFLGIYSTFRIFISDIFYFPTREGGIGI